jgi:hypothetical protein
VSVQVTGNKVFYKTFDGHPLESLGAQTLNTPQEADMIGEEVASVLLTASVRFCLY